MCMFFLNYEPCELFHVYYERDKRQMQSGRVALSDVKKISCTERTYLQYNFCRIAVWLYFHINSNIKSIVLSCPRLSKYTPWNNDQVFKLIFLFLHNIWKYCLLCTISDAIYTRAWFCSLGTALLKFFLIFSACDMSVINQVLRRYTEVKMAKVFMILKLCLLLFKNPFSPSTFHLFFKVHIPRIL